MKRTLLVTVMLLFVMAIPARADITLNIKLNFFGTQATEQGKSQVTTSFYLKSIVQRNLQVAFSTEALQAELKKTFNAPRVSLLAEGDLVWKSGGEPSVMQIVQINGRDYALILTPLPRPGAVNFKVGVVEDSNKKNIKNILLDTEIVLPDGEVAMLGFRDAQENSYFIAFYVQGRQEEFGKDAVRITGARRPRNIKKVNPIYPEEALKKRIEGVVILEAVADETGKVIELRMIKSPDQILTEAAIKAVKQWEYESYVINGKAKKVIFTVTVTFTLNPEQNVKKSATHPLIRLGGSRKPKLIKKVNPVYPPEAFKKKIEGIVIMEAVADEKGKVSDLRMISSPDPLLTKAAMEAVKQWEYKPFIKDGKATKVAFTATVTFSLNKD